MLNDVIKGKKKINKIRKKNMVLTSVMEESWGKFPPLLDHRVEANPKQKMKRKRKKEENEEKRK